MLWQCIDTQLFQGEVKLLHWLILAAVFLFIFIGFIRWAR